MAAAFGSPNRVEVVMVACRGRPRSRIDCRCPTPKYQDHRTLEKRCASHLWLTLAMPVDYIGPSSQNVFLEAAQRAIEGSK